jgi:hypothetical protein
LISKNLYPLRFPSMAMSQKHPRQDLKPLCQQVVFASGMFFSAVMSRGRSIELVDAQNLDIPRTTTHPLPKHPLRSTNKSHPISLQQNLIKQSCSQNCVPN